MPFNVCAGHRRAWEQLVFPPIWDKGISFIMAGKLTARWIASRAKRKGRYGDGDGLFLRVLDPGKRVYWTYRYTLVGKERETSIGPYPEMSLADARAKHAELRAEVLKKIDPLAGKRNGKAAVTTPSGKPTFGAMADDYVATHEGGWRNVKHRWQWTQTLTGYCAPIRDMAVDQIGTDDVLAVLTPLWTRAPVTGSRLRGRIEKVLDAARARGHIDRDRANPARWKGHLDLLLPKPAKLARGHHRAMTYADTAEFVQRLRAMNSTAALALEFLILTATRSGETLNARWDEILPLEAATWTVPKERMKTNEAFSIPLSDRALAILRTLEAGRGENPYIFAGRPQRPLSNMAAAMLLRRMKVAVTAHGFRTSFRTWCSEIAHAEFEVAELCLSHRIGSAVSRAYNRTSMLERRRPLMQAWADYVTGKTTDNVVPLRAAE
jgi:integrase